MTPASVRKEDLSSARNWVYIVFTLGGILFGAGMALASTRLGLGSLENSVTKLAEKDAKQDEIIDAVRMTQRDMLGELKFLNKQIEEAIAMRRASSEGRPNGQ